jgi:hypothetical protein
MGGLCSPNPGPPAVGGGSWAKELHAAKSAANANPALSANLPFIAFSFVLMGAPFI